ncbi:MAG: 2-phospho-L-lactate guanylyltransferase [Pseudomonadota bacterium]
MSGSTWALIPVKPLAQAKTRLAGVLAPAERRALVLHMLDDLLAALDEVAGLAGIALVSADPAVAELGAARGLRVLPEPRPGLNAALRGALAALAAEGAGRVLILPADIPLADGAALRRLLAAAPAAGPAAALVPAAADGGTNALLLAPPGLLEPAFGPGSCARFQRAARESGVTPVLLELPQLALDIDRPGDLLALESAGRGATRTRTYLRHIRARDRLGAGPQAARHAS